MYPHINVCTPSVLHQPHIHPREDTRKRRTCMHPGGHPPGEHMPYVITRAHTRGKLRLGCGVLFTFTLWNIQNKYIYKYICTSDVLNQTPHTPARGHPQAANMYMHPGGHPPQRAYAICGRQSARSNATGYVTRELKRGHPQMTSTCWGTQHAPVGTPPRRAYMCTQEDTPLANICRM